MRYYPMFMDLAGRRCLVVGAGAVAARKTRTLLDCGAGVTVIGVAPVPAFRALERRGVKILRRCFRKSDVRGQALVIGATDDPAVNTAVWAECRRRKIPVNVVDDPEHCTFIVPALLRRGDLAIAISTGGRSPAAARLVKERVAETVGQEYADLVALLGAHRGHMLREVKGPAARSRAWRRILEAGIVDALRRGDRRGARAIVRSVVAGAATASSGKKASPWGT